MRKVVLLLFGRPGAGKSSLSNNLVNQVVFQTSGGAASCTSTLQRHSVVLGGGSWTLEVIDTPGFENIDEGRRVVAEGLDSVDKSADVFVAFVHPTEKFLQEEASDFITLVDEFGPDFQSRTLIIFTKGDTRNLITLDEQRAFLSSTPAGFQELASKAGQRIYFCCQPPLNGGGDPELEPIKRKRHEQSRNSLLQALSELPQGGPSPNADHARQVWAGTKKAAEDAETAKIQAAAEQFRGQNQEQFQFMAEQAERDRAHQMQMMTMMTNVAVKTAEINAQRPSPVAEFCQVLGTVGQFVGGLKAAK